MNELDRNLEEGIAFEIKDPRQIRKCNELIIEINALLPTIRRTRTGLFVIAGLSMVSAFSMFFSEETTLIGLIMIGIAAFWIACGALTSRYPKTALVTAAAVYALLGVYGFIMGDTGVITVAVRLAILAFLIRGAVSAIRFDEYRTRLRRMGLPESSLARLNDLENVFRIKQIEPTLD